MNCLPFPLAERQKCAVQLSRAAPGGACAARALFREQYRTFEYAPLREAFEFRDVLHSARDIAPYNCLQFRYTCCGSVTLSHIYGSNVVMFKFEGGVAGMVMF